MKSYTFPLILIGILVSFITCDFSPHTSFSNLQTEKTILQKEFFALSQSWQIKKSYGKNVISEKSWGINQVVTVEIELSEVFNDLTKHDLKIDGDSLIMTGNDILKLEFNFKYTYSWLATGTGVGKTIMTGDTYSLVKTFSDALPNRIVPQVKLSFKPGEFTTEIEGYYDDNVGVKKLIENDIRDMIQSRVMEDISQDLGGAIDKFYLEYYAESHVDVTTQYPELQFTFENSFSELPKFKENGLVYYRNFSNEEQQLKDNETWDKFESSDGAHQLFYHQSILNEIAMKEVQNHRFGFKVSSKNYKNDLNVDTLSNYYRDILTTHPADETFSIMFLVNSMVLNTTSTNIDFKHVKATSKIKMNFISNSDQSILFSCNLTTSFAFEFKIITSESESKLSWNLLNNWQHFDINELSVDSAQYADVFISNLQDYIKSEFITNSGNLPFTFFKNGFPLWNDIDNFENVKYIDGFSLLIIGSNDPSSMNMINTKETVSKNDLLKFLK